MNKNISEAISKLEHEKQVIRKLLLSMNEEICNTTGGLLTVCSGSLSVEDVQLYHNRCIGTNQQAVDAIKDMADDAAIEVGWEDDTQICYRFKIDRAPFCIVLSKED